MLADEAAELPGFTLLRSTEVTDLLRDGGRVEGVRAVGPDGEVEVRARLTVGCDGRESVVRDRLGLRPVEYGAPMDVLWFRVSRASRTTRTTWRSDRRRRADASASTAATTSSARTSSPRAATTRSAPPA